jgi:hypothetical protein
MRIHTGMLSAALAALSALAVGCASTETAAYAVPPDCQPDRAPAGATAPPGWERQMPQDCLKRIEDSRSTPP